MKKVLQCSPLDKAEAEENIAAGEDPSLYFIEVDESADVEEKAKKKDKK